MTDGFSGNVVLKALEGSLPAIVGAVVQALTATDELASRFEVDAPGDRRAVREPRTGALRGRDAAGGRRGVRDQPRLLERSKAILNAIKVAREMVDEDVVAELRAAVAGRSPATSA